MMRRVCQRYVFDGLEPIASLWLYRTQTAQLQPMRPLNEGQVWAKPKRLRNDGRVGENHGRIEEYAFRTSLSMIFTEWQREAIHAR